MDVPFHFGMLPHLNASHILFEEMNRGKDVQLPVHLLGLHGHVAIQPQQIKPNNAPHAHPRFRRGHYRARVTSQLKVAA